MSLDQTVELSVMQAAETNEAAQILMKSLDLWLNFPDRVYDPNERDHLAKLLTREQQVVVGKTGGNIVAAYKLPKPFTREGDLITIGPVARATQWEAGGFFYYGVNGHFAVAEEGKGIGRAFFRAFGGLLEQLAYEVDASSIVHRDVIPEEGEHFAVKMGYKVRTRKQAGMTDFLTVERHYMPTMPTQRALSEDANKVLGMLETLKAPAAMLL